MGHMLPSSSYHNEKDEVMAYINIFLRHIVIVGQKKFCMTKITIY